MELLYWSSVLILSIVCASGPAEGMHPVSVTSFFPELHRDLSKVTWAHAVNSRARLQQVLQDKKTMMIEADILMGRHSDHSEEIPIMAHPPQNTSDLTFADFYDTVLKAAKDGVRIGVKLDFKDIQSVEPCLKHIQSRESPMPSIPVMINADILPGPVNATKVPLPAVEFIQLVSKHAPYATLSVGWTTRYGNDDPTEEVREGSYTKQQMKDMIKVIRNAGDPPKFPHVTFPVRAGLAAASIDVILFLTSRVHGSSITLWSAGTDPVNVESLNSLIAQQNPRNTFIDLPFSLEEDDDSIVVEAPTSSIQHLSGRGQDEGAELPSNSSSRLLSPTIWVFLAIGIILSFLYSRN